MSEKEGSRDIVGGHAGDRDEEPRPFIDEVFAVLADWRRREVSRFFVETGAETASVDDLALLVAGCRPGDAEGPPPAHGDLVAALEERHLPRLDAVGVIDYDPRSGTVRYRGQPTLEKWLEHVTAVDDGRI